MLRSVLGPMIALLLCLALFQHKVKGQLRGRDSTTNTNNEAEKTFRRLKAKEVLKYMNRTVDPCNDFYDFACGNWAQYHRAESEGDFITTQSDLELLVNVELQKVLSRSVSQDSDSTRKVKDLYRSCLTVEKKSQQQRSFLLNFVRKHGGLPSLRDSNWNDNYNWLHVLALLRANYGLDILIGLDIDVNLSTMHGHRICLTEPKNTLLPAEMCSSLATKHADLRDQAYNAVQREVSNNMQSWFSWGAAEANRFAGDIVSFEFELCKEMRKDHTMRAQDEQAQNQQNEVLKMRGMHTARHNMLQEEEDNDAPYLYETLDKLTLRFGKIIDFKKFVYFTLNVTSNDMVYMRSQSYFKQLALMLKPGLKPTLPNYIMYRALVNFDIPDDNRPKYCVEQVMRYFPKHVGELYNRRMYRGEVKTEVELLSKSIVNSFEDSLNVEWLDTNDKHAINQKLSQYVPHFPNYHNLELNDFQLERAHYWNKLEAAMKYNAMQKLDPHYSGEYRSSLNRIESTAVDVKLVSKEILIGWGLLQEPFYHYSYPKVLKYSLVGQRIARELASAFAEQQWSDNLLVTAPWNEYTLAGYRNQSECLRKQYSNYLYNNPDMFQNASKLQELIADNSGLNIAFNAYLGWLLQTDYRPYLIRETLPEVNFSNTQLFFINFAQLRCAAKYGDKPAPDFFPMDKHTPERYHVNGPLANCVEFAREFGCAMGTEMNPDDKCVIY